MSSLLAMKKLLESEQERQNKDILNLKNIIHLLQKLETKIEEGLAELNPKSQYRLLGIHDVMDLIGLGDKWISDRVAERQFPAPRIIGGKRKWYQKEIEKWIQEEMGRIEH